ncbi:2-C-methyl-D-erythritol 4-phosphate cytidylyltransferase [Romboutsia weinsteinii]|uniref:2-C-methyl-D-erythritol 4-phosphate cytidylyltransferase n=1 Tax=Romboutsia weinsteinii TaxID=2020949 RepID=A0A371IXA4_9FIRM|nr:2-C-methyl-D-erythritol 4-phosphate cytidylyltransferase [Romboutsia weinsteinii]RDY25112.1 2-C-methyl-D-erythritol 4-phosphate cytidylyltransferase [Romboutsia weinsteinii]
MNSALIVAAGSGKRMNAGINKQFIKLKNKEIIAYTIESFCKNENIDEIVVCIKKDEEEFFKEHILDKYKFKNIRIAYGGKERQDSIYNGLKEVNKNCDIILVHDGARPFVDNRIINESIESAKEKKAVVVGVPVKDTIKIVNEDIVESTPERSTLWAAQTPQAFKYKLLVEAYEEAYKNNYYGTDDSMLVENMGQKVTMIMGSYENIKITSPEDINFGEQILNTRR